MTALVQAVKNILRQFKRKLEGSLPRNLNVSSPIVQIYLGGEYETRYSLVNFPSLLSPMTAYTCIYDIALYSKNGSCVGKRSISLEPFQSYEVRPSEIFGENLPDLGMLTAKIRSASPLVFSDKHLGKITPHIYALYSDKERRSLVLVHPQTTLVNKASKNQEWRSGVLLDSNKIKRVIAIQINPSKQSAKSTLFLYREGEERKWLGEMNGEILPMGARKIEWDIAKTGISKGNFSIGANTLLSPNAKPIILTYFDNETFTGMHA